MLIFDPDKIFDQLDNHIVQILSLKNIEVSNRRQMVTRTLGTVTILELLGQKNIEVIKDDLTIYQAKKTDKWLIEANYLDEAQVKAIEHLPLTKEEILLDFYGRKLTESLKIIFKQKGYQVGKTINLNSTQVPYKFEISPHSKKNELVFVGTKNDGIKSVNVFGSQFKNNGELKILLNNIPLEHLNRLSLITDELSTIH